MSIWGTLPPLWSNLLKKPPSLQRRNLLSKFANYVYLKMTGFCVEEVFGTGVEVKRAKFTLEGQHRVVSSENKICLFKVLNLLVITLDHRWSDFLNNDNVQTPFSIIECKGLRDSGFESRVLEGRPSSSPESIPDFRRNSRCRWILPGVTFVSSGMIHSLRSDKCWLIPNRLFCHWSWILKGKYWRIRTLTGGGFSWDTAISQKWTLSYFFWKQLNVITFGQRKMRTLSKW
jgi:hypothetical protein